MAKTALVTGATSGIGEALCLLLASDGYNLVTVARNEGKLEKQADDLRRLDIEVAPIPCDLSREGAAHALFDAVRERGLDIDVLVNDAGYSVAEPFADLDTAEIRSLLQLSVVNLAELTSAFLDPLLQRGHGRILNISSLMALAPAPGNALYGAAKAFILSFTLALAAELEGTGVTATVACPGATRTNFSKNAGIEDAPAWKYFAMSADETAIRAYRALMRGDPFAVIGWHNKLGALSTRLMPRRLQALAGAWLMGPQAHPFEGKSTARSGEHSHAPRRDNDEAEVEKSGAPEGAAGRAAAGEADARPNPRPQVRVTGDARVPDNTSGSGEAYCRFTWHPW